MDGNPETSIKYYYSFHYYWHIVNEEDEIYWKDCDYVTIELLNIDEYEFGKFIG